MFECYDGIISLLRISSHSALHCARTSLLAPTIKPVLKVRERVASREGMSTCFLPRLEDAADTLGGEGARSEIRTLPRPEASACGLGLSHRLTPATDLVGHLPGVQKCCLQRCHRSGLPASHPQRHPAQAGYELQHREAGILNFLFCGVTCPRFNPHLLLPYCNKTFLFPVYGA